MLLETKAVLNTSPQQLLDLTILLNLASKPPTPLRAIALT